ncbi:hypothetical protein L0P88_15700 [Muricauda sp. SCSIO 64092]|uniref:hypothetical protein n=1 Tax=Allomuricauda sp. SCSIO 64092 TaxID=2908842 RepID=UPI001FF1EA83|nr:hypothetical protein [Muricauda sp. SCSIO 64092]UOY05390.1 hypothetical protein L0P88_15700 [Muricauda sp. SCSIO 64092]
MSLSKEDKSVIHQFKEEKDMSEFRINELQKQLDSSVLSVYWELKVLLGIGISFFSIGILNIIIDHFDHYLKWILVTILLIAFLSTSYYCFTRKEPFSWGKIEQKARFFDLVLVACTTFFLSLEGYVQYEFKIFGNRYDDIAIITTLFYFFCAYYFDSRVILTKGLIAFTAWFSIAFDIFSWENPNVFMQDIPVAESTLIGVGFLIVGYLTSWKNWKKHFKKTYLIFATQLIMLALTANLVYQENPNILYFGLIIVGSIVFLALSRKEKSPIVSTTTIIYLYVAMTTYFKVFKWKNEYATSLYLICTAFIVIAYFLVKRNRHDQS